MANPVHHSLSSVHKWGGLWTDYIHVHSWFDQTKAHTSDPRHRMVLHNTMAVFMLEQQLGAAIVRADGKLIPTRWIGEQHCEEDLRTTPSVARCFEHCREPKGQWLVFPTLHHAKSSAHQFGGSVADYLPIHTWLDQASDHLPDTRANLLFHNSFGVALAVQRFGAEIETGHGDYGNRVSVRKIVIDHIESDHMESRVPTLTECLEYISRQPWMGKLPVKLSEESHIQLLAIEASQGDSEDERYHDIDHVRSLSTSHGSGAVSLGRRAA